jgi:hypothetical protein
LARVSPPSCPGSFNTFLRLRRNLHRVFLLYWMTRLSRRVRHGSQEPGWKAALTKQILIIRCATPNDWLRRPSTRSHLQRLSNLSRKTKAPYPLDTTAPSQVEQLVAAALDSRPLEAPWSLPRRILFRFICFYLVLYIASNMAPLAPDVPWLTNAWNVVWHKLVPWAAIHMFHLSGKATTYFDTGSGDTTLDYVQTLLFVVFSVSAAVIWSLADHRRKDYRWLHSWLRVLVRYSLAYTMLLYGLGKVFPGVPEKIIG